MRRALASNAALALTAAGSFAAPTLAPSLDEMERLLKRGRALRAEALLAALRWARRRGRPAGADLTADADPTSSPTRAASCGAPTGA